MRDYELLYESVHSWSTDPNASLFLVKKTNLGPHLTTSAPLSEEPEGMGAYLQMEVKRNKWAKRWLEIRNQSIFVGKSEKVSLQFDGAALAELRSIYISPAIKSCSARCKASMHIWFRKLAFPSSRYPSPSPLR